MNQRASGALAVVATLAGLLVCTSCGREAPTPPTAPPADRSAAPVADAPPAVTAPSATRTVTVRVLTREGDAPIPGAHVIIATGGDEEPGPAGSADTDAEGRARVVLPADVLRQFDITVCAAGHTRDLQYVEGDATAGEIVSHLDPAGEVRGVVRGSGGKPVAGADVDVEFDDSEVDVPEVTTGDDGAFALDGVPLGKTFDLVALGDSDHGDRRMARRRGMSVESAGAVIAADLTLVEPAEISVRVLWADGLPITGASVVLEPGPADGSSGEDGTASLAPVPAQHQTVTVRCWGFSDARAELDLNPGEKKTITLHPAPGPTISGVVVDEEQRPVADARVMADANDAPIVRTRADGAFRIACPDEAPRAIDAVADGFSSADVADVAAPANDVRIVLRRIAHVRCRLVWPAGMRPSPVIAAWVDGRVTFCSLEGDLLHIAVPRGAKRVTVRAGSCVAVTREVDAARGGEDDWGDVQLVAATRLVVHVVDAEGKPLTAFVYPKVRDVTEPLKSTEDDGTATFRNLPAGDAEVRVEADGFVQRTVHCALSSDSAPLEVALSRGGGVRGLVLGADGKPAPGVVYVSFSDAGDPKNRDRTASPSVGDDGRFEVHLAPGRYRAETSLDANEATAEVEVADGKTVEITLKLAPR